MKAPPDLSKLSDPELDSLFRQLEIEIKVNESHIEPDSQANKRSRKVLRGTALNVLGLVLSVPTSGLSLLLMLPGMIDWADALEEDASVMNTQLRLQRELDEYRALFKNIIDEKARRKRVAPSPPSANSIPPQP